jgi:GNAT superfamily N-acetyltransferase
MELNSTNSPLYTKPVTTDNWKDFEDLFEGKGGPKYCWCMAWRLTKEERKNNTKECKKVFIKDRVEKGIPIGIIAYMDDIPIGWCSVGPRESFQGLDGNNSIKNVWSITCFYIRKAYRGKELTKYLLQDAIEYGKKNGTEYMEAYGVNEDSPSYRYMGFKKLYEESGFEYVKMAGTRRHVMDLRL